MLFQMGSSAAIARQSPEAQKKYPVPEPNKLETKRCPVPVLGELERRALKYAEELVKRDAEIEKLKAAIETERQLANGNLSKCDETLKKAREEGSKKDAELKSVYARLDAYDKDKVANNDEMSALRVENGELRKQIDDLNGIVESMRKDNESLQKAISDGELKLNTVNGQLSTCQGDLVTANQEKSTCQTNLETSAQGLTTCQNNLGDIESKLAEANAAVEQHKSRVNILYVVAGVLIAIVIGFGVWIFLLNKGKGSKNMKGGNIISEVNNDSMYETVYNANE